jgi:hypothetical protein
LTPLFPCGWMSETRVLEVAERQRVLSEAEAVEARWLAAQRFDTARLPGDAQALPAETDEQNHTG